MISLGAAGADEIHGNTFLLEAKEQEQAPKAGWLCRTHGAANRRSGCGLEQYSQPEMGYGMAVLNKQLFLSPGSSETALHIASRAWILRAHRAESRGSLQM